MKGGGVQTGHEKKNEEPLHDSKDEDEKELKRKSLPIKMGAEELSEKENEGPRKGVETECISREDVEKETERKSEKSPQ